MASLPNFLVLSIDSQLLVSYIQPKLLSGMAPLGTSDGEKDLGDDSNKQEILFN